jgi:hypothetical protein
VKARKPARRTSTPTPDPVIATVLREADDAVRFGMTALLKAHAPTAQRPAEMKLLALACFDEALSKIGCARMRHGSADGRGES